MKRKMEKLIKDLIGGMVLALMFGISLGAVIICKDESRAMKQKVGQALVEVGTMQEAQEEELQRLEKLEEQQKNVEENNRRYAAELEVLARCVEAEAGNQSIDVKRAVVSVILNRVDDEDWPDTISEVIADPYEFATYWNGAMDEVTPSTSTYEAIALEMETRSYQGLYYFDMDQYLQYGTPYKKMGDLYFSTK